MKYTAPVFVLICGLWLAPMQSSGKPEYTKKEKKPCTTCHTKANSKELNEAGKFYQKNKTLDGYKEAK
jgi:hypothetical protein